MTLSIEGQFILRSSRGLELLIDKSMCNCIDPLQVKPTRSHATADSLTV